MISLPRVCITLTVITLVTLAANTAVIGQGQAPAGGAGRGRLDPPTPPAVQPGHPSGTLVIWGDMADFARPGTAAVRCFATSRFHRGQRAGFRMTAIDGGTGEVENSTEMVIHITHAGKTFDLPMRWRGNQSYPAAEYIHAPVEMWTGVWEVPADAPLGTASYTVTAKDKFGRTATFNPFPNHLSQLSIVE